MFKFACFDKDYIWLNMLRREFIKLKNDDISIFAFPLATVPYSCMYSGTPPYDHPVYKTTSLLRPYSFKPNVTTIESFYYFEDPVNATTSLLRPGFYGPTVVALTGFHCNVLHPRSSTYQVSLCLCKNVVYC